MQRDQTLFILALQNQIAPNRTPSRRSYEVSDEMEQLSIANARLKSVKDEVEKDYESLTAELDSQEPSLKKRLEVLNQKKFDSSHANLDARQDDLVEVNAGGKIILAKRSTLTQVKETRFEALFSGRWDKMLERDHSGRIFLDVNPVCFQAIVDYLHELAISSEENPPSPPSVEDDDSRSLTHQLGLFGLITYKYTTPESSIVKTIKKVRCLYHWLEEANADGDLKLLYRSSRDGASSENFHSKCDNQGCTLTIIETTDGFVLGGYSNVPWSGPIKKHCLLKANTAFLFVLSGSDVSKPCKMKLKDENDGNAVWHYAGYGPTFGSARCDLNVTICGSAVHVFSGHHFEPYPSEKLVATQNDYTTHTVKEMEVFQVSRESWEMIAPGRAGHQSQQVVPHVEPVTRFAEEVNEAINAKQEALQQAEAGVLGLEKSFQDEQHFVSSFATGQTKDIVMLSVSGTRMATKRSTLRVVEDSVLAQQFDESKWTEQGCEAPIMKKWTTGDVSSWVDSLELEGIQSDFGYSFEENDINGPKLLALIMEGLKAIRMEREGTSCPLLEDVEELKHHMNTGTLIEHSPYCFNKILDFLRSKRLHTLGLAEEPTLPKVRDSKKGRFEKIVKYYFPGDAAKKLLD
ncbi:hypothetical protein ACHAWF_008226 [Thalassiosira exigua]